MYCAVSILVLIIVQIKSCKLYSKITLYRSPREIVLYRWYSINCHIRLNCMDRIVRILWILLCGFRHVDSIILHLVHFFIRSYCRDWYCDHSIMCVSLYTFHHVLCHSHDIVQMHPFQPFLKRTMLTGLINYWSIWLFMHCIEKFWSI